MSWPPPCPLLQFGPVQGSGGQVRVLRPGAGCVHTSHAGALTWLLFSLPLPQTHLTRRTKSRCEGSRTWTVRGKVWGVGRRGWGLGTTSLGGEGLVRSPPPSACCPHLRGPATAGLVFWPDVITGENAVVLWAPPRRRVPRGHAALLGVGRCPCDVLNCLGPTCVPLCATSGAGFQLDTLLLGNRLPVWAEPEGWPAQKMPSEWAVSVFRGSFFRVKLASFLRI